MDKDFRLLGMKAKLYTSIDVLGKWLHVHQPVTMNWSLTHRDSGAVKQAAARGPYNTASHNYLSVLQILAKDL